MSDRAAWTVDDFDGDAHFFHAPLDSTDENLCIRAADLLDCTPEDVDRAEIRRCPEMDGLAFTAKNLLERGAVSWYECRGCGQQVESEGDGPHGRSIGRWDDETDEWLGPPVFHENSVFCGHRCIRKEIARLGEWLNRNDGDSPWVRDRNAGYSCQIADLERVLAEIEMVTANE